MSRFRHVALLLLVLVLATGLAFAQPQLKVSQVSSTGAITQSTFDPTSAAVAKAPLIGHYWDGLASTNFYNVPPYIAAPPNPQIAVGPDDVLTIVNRTIARYQNPNAAGATGPSNPYNNPPTEQAFLDVWLGISNLASLCPSGTGSNAVCVIDHPTIRYDQLQGRFVVVFTVTDMPAHRSNFVLIVSKFSQFTKCSTTPVPATCPASSPLFTPPVVAPVVGGTSTGGVNSANWVLYMLPINLGAVVGASGPPTAVSTTFCANGGAVGACTNYFPTDARMGFDNDNIILTAPVLDMTQAGPGIQGTLPTVSGALLGPYAGTRVVTVPKLVVYNGTTLAGTANLADDTATGTLTGCSAPGVTAGLCTATNPVPAPGVNPVPAMFWEPNNLRGRALASFNSQVAPLGNAAAGVITPIDYLVGTLITDILGPNGYNLPAGPLGGVLTTPIAVQPIVFTCPANAIFSGPAGVTFCGNAGGGQVPDAPALGPLKVNVSGLALATDPAPVGQSNANDGTSMTNKRLFVGDSRPQQVMFREGLLYIARTVRLFDLQTNASGTSTVMYDVLRQQGCTVPSTTITAAMNATTTTAPLASVANVSVNSVLQIDTEQMVITAISGNNATVVRGVNGTTAASHANGATVTIIVSCSFSATGANLPNPALVLETEWFNGQNVPDPTGNVSGFGFYQPMFDSPANVINNGPGSPVNLFPWLEKLFVGMTTGGTSNLANTFANNHPSLWDFRPGDDAYDTIQPYLDPYTGIVVTTITACTPGGSPCSMIPFGTRGGASTDPNDGSLWLYGEFAKNRLSSIPGPGQWGTAVANYALDFPASDPYGNDNSFFADVQPGNPFFTWIQIAKNVGIAQSAGPGTCPANPPGNPPILQPPAPGTTPNPGASTLVCPTFGPTTIVTRSEMARWVILGQMDEAQVNAYLAATGGNPAADPRFSSFADDLTDPNLRYIEALYRRGYTKGCGTTNDGRRAYCPTDPITRGQMAVFLIRAKMNNVFPTTLSGIPLSTPYGDNFGLFQQSTPYFTDVATTDPFYLYIQKMRELRISNGTGASTYSPGNSLTRQEIATFIVRAFFL